MLTLKLREDLVPLITLNDIRWQGVETCIDEDVAKKYAYAVKGASCFYKPATREQRLVYGWQLLVAAGVCSDKILTPTGKNKIAGFKPSERESVFLREKVFYNLKPSDFDEHFKEYTIEIKDRVIEVAEALRLYSGKDEVNEFLSMCKGQQQGSKDYTSYYSECISRLISWYTSDFCVSEYMWAVEGLCEESEYEVIEYMLNRGISITTLIKFKIGLDYINKVECMVIPISKNSYMLRNTNYNPNNPVSKENWKSRQYGREDISNVSLPASIIEYVADKACSVYVPKQVVEEEEQKESDSKCLSFPDNVPCEDNDALIDDSQDYFEAMSELTEVFAQCKEDQARPLNPSTPFQSHTTHTSADDTLAPTPAKKIYEQTDNATHLYIDDNTHIQKQIEEAIEPVQSLSQATDEKKQSSKNWIGEIRKGLKKKKDVKEFTQKEQSTPTEEDQKDDLRQKEDVPQTVIQSIDSSIAAKRCSALPEGKQGLEALKEYWERNIKLIDVVANGALRVSGEDEIAKRYTSDESVIKGWINEGIKIFRFIPKDTGWLCLDIDCKNGKDGVKDLFSFFNTKGLSEELLPKIFQEFPANFPCWLTTPSGGYHLYFKVPDEFEMKKSCALLAGYPSLEILYEKAPNVAGSFKDGKPYVLYGSFDNIPNLPQVIQTAIDSPKDKQQSKIKPVQKETQKLNVRKPNGNRKGGKPSWDNIVKWTDEDNGYTYAGRNDKAFKLACKNRYKGYSEYETVQCLLNEPSVSGLSIEEIDRTVKSAYRY